MFFIYILLIIILQSLTSIIEHHNGSFKQTLRDLYPAAGIDTNRFASLPGIRTSPVISPFLSYGFFNSYYILFHCTCILCLSLFFFVFFFDSLFLFSFPCIQVDIGHKQKTESSSSHPSRKTMASTIILQPTGIRSLTINFHLER